MPETSNSEQTHNGGVLDLDAIEARAHAAGRKWSSEPWTDYIVRTLPLMEKVAREDVPALVAEVRRLRRVVESDRTAYARTAAELHRKVGGWTGMATSRGAYAWDDDRYREEFGRALAEFEAISARMLEVTRALDWTDSPQTDAEVQAGKALPFPQPIRVLASVSTPTGEVGHAD